MCAKRICGPYVLVIKMHTCKERDSPDDGFPLYRFDMPLPFFALTILRRYISMSVALVTLVN
jgi:hypothetical protein